MDFSNHKTIQKSFTWVKKNLDPAMSYIIFENDLKKENHSIFSECLVAYHYLKKGNYTWQKVYDSKYCKEYLVIQIDPGTEDRTLGKVMGYGFPQDTVYYLYKAETGHQ